MTSSEFRRIALALEGASESSHMGHPDFRANGKIFATLQYPNENYGMVKLPPEQQDNFVRTHPKAFIPVKGAWGRQGCTNVLLDAVQEPVLEEALRAAWSSAGKPSRGKSGARKRARTR
jgi:YjbR